MENTLKCLVFDTLRVYVPIDKELVVILQPWIGKSRFALHDLQDVCTQQCNTGRIRRVKPRLLQALFPPTM